MLAQAGIQKTLTMWTGMAWTPAPGLRHAGAGLAGVTVVAVTV